MADVIVKMFIVELHKLLKYAEGYVSGVIEVNKIGYLAASIFIVYIKYIKNMQFVGSVRSYILPS